MSDQGFQSQVRARARDTVEAHGHDPALYKDAIDQYARTAEDVQYLRQLWDAEGSPAYALGGNGNLCTHPMLKAIQDAEKLHASIAKTLTLTPEAYAGLQKTGRRQMGQSQAADRQGLRRAA